MPNLLCIKRLPRNQLSGLCLPILLLSKIDARVHLPPPPKDDFLNAVLMQWANTVQPYQLKKKLNMPTT